jgi:hypothetical protein
MRRGLFAFIVLSVLFVAFSWIALAIALVTGGEQAPTGALCSTVCFGVILVGALLPVALHRSKGRRIAARSVAENEDAAALLRVGRYAEAAEIWERLTADVRWFPHLHALYVYNLGMSSLFRGDPERALALLEAAMGSGWIGKVYPHVVPMVENGRALAYAILGDLDRAAAHRDEAVAKVTESRKALTLLTDTLIAARRGAHLDPPSAETLRAAEGVLPPNLIRGVPLLHAFARAGGEGSYRKAEVVETISASPGELDFLAARWPELRAFMDVNGLLAKSAPRA